MDTKDMIAYSFVGLVVLVAIIVKVFIWALRPSRMVKLQSFWDAFHQPKGCKNALALYEEGLFIVRRYGIPFHEIYCLDRETFHIEAIHALKRSISMSDNNDETVQLRADLARLMLFHASDEERKAAANKFITIEAS